MEDVKLAMRNKDANRKNKKKMVRAAVKQKEVDERKEITDDEIIDIISKQFKEKRAAIDEFRKGNRNDLIEQTEKEMDILLEYLHEKLGEEEVDEIVSENIDEVNGTSKK